MKPVMIGITGPAAGGKSLVMEALRRLRHFTIDSDSVAKRVVYTEKTMSIWLIFLGKIFFTKTVK